MAGVVHHEQFVGATGDCPEQVCHFAICNLVAVVRQEGFHTPTCGFVFEAGAMP